jgi:hypothetical protein
MEFFSFNESKNTNRTGYSDEIQGYNAWFLTKVNGEA